MEEVLVVVKVLVEKEVIPVEEVLSVEEVLAVEEILAVEEALAAVGVLVVEEALVVEEILVVDKVLGVEEAPVVEETVELGDKAVEVGEDAVPNDEGRVCSDSEDKALEMLAGGDAGVLEAGSDELLVVTSVLAECVWPSDVEGSNTDPEGDEGWLFVVEVEYDEYIKVILQLFQLPLGSSRHEVDESAAGDVARSLADKGGKRAEVAVIGLAVDPE